MVWIFVTNRNKYEVKRVSDPNYFSKHNEDHIIMSMQPHRSKLVKEMIQLAKMNKCRHLDKFVREFIKDHPEYQI